MSALQQANFPPMSRGGGGLQGAFQGGPGGAIGLGGGPKPGGLQGGGGLNLDFGGGGGGYGGYGVDDGGRGGGGGGGLGSQYPLLQTQASGASSQGSGYDGLSMPSVGSSFGGAVQLLKLVQLLKSVDP
jgi:hypothetical protein